MVRGYDVIFQNKLLGFLFTGALTFIFIALLIWGALHAKKMMEQDSAARKKFREEQMKAKQTEASRTE